MIYRIACMNELEELLLPSTLSLDKPDYFECIMTLKRLQCLPKHIQYINTFSLTSLSFVEGTTSII